MFAYAYIGQPKSVSDLGAVASLTEAFAFFLGFNILAVEVVDIPLVNLKY